MTDHIPRSHPICTCGKPALVHRPKHRPNAWPVCGCGAESVRHRVRHKPTGDPCECGIPAVNHIKRSPREVKRAYLHEYVGIDGEGVGRNPHRYILLAAANNNGTTWYTENPNGLTTKQCLDFILGLPSGRLFSYSFGYDLTKILQDLDNKSLYELFRPSTRYQSGEKRVRGPKAIIWQGYKLNWMNGKFTVRRGKQQRSIWDLYKFYQSTFVTALERWQVGDPDYIQSMKARRGQFTIEELPAIRKYCFTECTYLAQLARRLIETHIKVGLKLHTYYGPGSTAGVALKRMGIRELRGEHPAGMTTPIACGFFGGRFEHAVMGAILAAVFGYDISSAYPYHLFQLPCLACGAWRYTKREADLDKCRAALVRYSYRGRADQTWAPFPVRDAKGSICYPYRGEGWTWLAEYQAGCRHFKGVGFRGAWVYETDCDCQPFAPVAQYYRDRVTLGKDAAGIILKLAINSIYGKLAQSLGLNPAFQCWIWAGMVTAGTRAQILDLMHAGSRSDVLAIATDGVYTKRKHICPRPIDTGTYDLRNSKGDLVPLGGWEEKVYQDGMFFVKPGIYFPLASDIDSDYLRARGIGRRSLLENRDLIMSAYDPKVTECNCGKPARPHAPHIDLPPVERFNGAKTCINHKHRRATRYGEWLPMPIRLAFDCPNRNPDMSLRATDYVSHPYSKGLIGPEKLQALIEEALDYEQPK